MATQAQILVNGTPGSDDDITLNTLVQLNNQGAGGESTYEWTLVSQPSGSPAAVLSSTSIQAPTFTPNKEGSYLVQLVVNKGLADEQSDRVIVAVRELETRNRIPAAGETTENNAETGWANTAVDQILQRVTRFADQGVLVGKAGEAGLLPLDVVYVADVTTIATGLPGQREVPQFAKAYADVAGKVRGLVGVVLDGVNGSPAPAAGDLIRVMELGIIREVDLGTAGQPDGTPVYVDNLGHLSLTPGTVIRQLGTTIDDMTGGKYGVWITGESAFGTLQDVNATAPLTKVAGVVPTLGLAYDADTLRVTGGTTLDLTETGVTAGSYGEAAPAYPATPASLVATVTVDAYGRITAASQGGLSIGGKAAKTYIDDQDAATLTLAQNYANSLSYGLGSKTPAHLATTTALPPCTPNASFMTLTANVHGPLGQIDGHTLLVGERLLVKNEVASTNNGIYTLTQEGQTSGPSRPWILTRATDADTAAELCGSLITVNVGNVNAGTAWIFSSNPATFVFGTTPVQWTQLNAVPAQDGVLGTVRLNGALGGTSSTALLPVVALGSGYVSGVLPAANGGTGLSSSVNDSLLISDNSGGWTTRVNYPDGNILYGPMLAPLNLRGIWEGVTSVSSLTILNAAEAFNKEATLSWVSGTNVVISPRSTALETMPGDITVQGGAAITPGVAGDAVLKGGDINGVLSSGGRARVIGGTGILAGGGAAQVYGGDADSSGNYSGGAALIRGGTSYGTSNGGSATLLGGSAQASGSGGLATIVGGSSATGIGGPAYLHGGQGAAGGFASIRGGVGASASGGSVEITGGNGATDGGPVTITGGPASTTCGSVLITGGGTSTTISGGDVNITGGQCSALSPTASAGYVNITGGSGGSGGGVNIDGGISTLGNTHGDVFISGGRNEDTAAEYQGGDIVLLSGNSRTGPSYNGARIALIGSSRNYGGGIEITPGYGDVQNGAVFIARAILNNGGTAGQVLLSAGSSSPAVWGTPDYYADPGTAAYGSFRYTGVNTTFTATDLLIYTITAAVTVTLPAASTVPEGRIYMIKCGYSGGATLAAAAGDQIDTASGPWALTQWQVLRVMRVAGVTSEWLFI